MNILVLYQSRGGNTKQTAEAIARAVREQGFKADVRSVVEVQKAEVKSADLIFLGTWIQGFIVFGVKPAGADQWVKALPSLDGKPVAIFCTYAINPRASLDKLRDLLQARGAKVVDQHAFQRSHLDDGVKAFVQSVLHNAERMPA